MDTPLCQCLAHDKRPELTNPNKSYQNSDGLISTNSVWRPLMLSFSNIKNNVVVVQQNTKILKDITLLGWQKNIPSDRRLSIRVFVIYY